MVWEITATSSEETFKKILRMTRFIGLAPLDDRCQLSPKYILCSVGMVVYLTSSTTYFLLSGDPILARYSTTHRYLFGLRKIWEVVTLSMVVCIHGYKRDKLRSVLEHLKTLESALAPRRWVWSLPPRAYLGNVLLFLFMYLLQRTFFTITASATLIWTTGYVAYISIAVFTNQFCAFYGLMGHCLREVTASKTYSTYPWLYSTIKDACEDLNDLYGLPILSILTLYFIGTLHQVYQLFGSFGKPFMVSFLIMVHTSCFMTMLLQITLSANEITSEMKKFNSTLHMELAEKRNRQLPNYEVLLFHIEKIKEFEFTANGFLTVNKPFLCSIILAWTTYLVILLQYSPSLFEHPDVRTWFHK